MKNIVNKAYALSNARIKFVSLVDKAANKKQFLITKADDNSSANFQSFGKIVKADLDSHFVTGIVYEPMVEDSQGEYMTAEEIIKAAHWFMKNDGDVDIQHCFEKANGVEIVESFVAKSDMEINGTDITEGTWLMTMEVTDETIWNAIQKGEITGFSMGGTACVSDEDVTLDSDDDVEKSDKETLFQKLAKAFGYEVVEKGTMASSYRHRVRGDNFYTAWYALRDTLEGYTYDNETGSYTWGYTDDEKKIREALEDFVHIVTEILAGDSVTKELSKAAKEQSVQKAGKSMSAKNLEALTGICNSLTEFVASFTPDDTTGDGDVAKSSANNLNNPQKEEKDMKKSEVQALVEESISKAMGPINEQLKAIVKGDGAGDGTDGGESTPAPADKEASAEDVSTIIENTVAKALEPITEQLAVIRKSRAIPSNLNDVPPADVQKSQEEHYLHGII